MIASPRILAVALCISAAVLHGSGRTAMGDDPAKGSGELEAAIIAINNKNWPAAVEKLEAANRTDGRNAEVHNLLGYSYRNIGDMDRAFTHYHIALEIDAQHKSAHEYIGEAYLMAQQPGKAREHLARLKAICGEGCKEYQDLAKAIDAYKP